MKLSKTRCCCWTDDKRERYEKVTPEDIMALAEKVFRTKNLVIGIKGRKKKLDLERIRDIFAILDDF